MKIRRISMRCVFGIQVLALCALAAMKLEGGITVEDEAGYFKSQANQPSFTITPALLGGFDANGVDKLVVSISGEDVADNTVSTVTYGGVSMTKAVQYAFSFRDVSIWYLDNVAVGGDIVVSFVESQDGIGLGAVALNGTLDGVAAISSDGTGAITTTTDFEFVMSAGFNNDTSLPANAPLMQLFSGNTGSSGGGAGYYLVPTAGLFTPSFTGAEGITSASFAAVPSDPEVFLSDNTVSSNAPPGTLVGTLTMVYTNDASGFAYTLREVDDYAYFDIASGTTNLRVAAWLDKASFSVSVVGTKGAVSYTNDFTITASSASDLPIFIVPAEVQHGSGDGTLIGTVETMRSGTTFSIVSGRTDLFYLDGDDLKLMNAAAWGGIGSTNYVTLRAVKGAATNELVVAASVVENATNGTVFRFR